MQQSSASDRFDEFYVTARRRLLLQTLALTGDLSASRSAVRDAFVIARHHWRKVSRLADPEGWVRTRAWSMAQRRSAGRIWHRERHLDAQQRRVLEQLQKLPDVQRKVLLLTHLTTLPLAQVGAEVGQVPARTERLLQRATARLSLALDCDSALLRTQLDSLAPLVAHPGLPRASMIQRSGRRRRRWHLVLGGALAVGLVLGTGALVRDPGVVPASASPGPQLTEAMLLRPGQAPGVDAGWRVVRTDHNTAGDGLNSPCQATRFADPRGRNALVRVMRSNGPPGAAGRPSRPSRSRLVQTVEASATPGAAERAFRTTLGWYAGCRHLRARLMSSYRIDRLGGPARVLRLRLPGRRLPVLTVAVARNGSLTGTVVVQSPNDDPPGVARLARTVRAGLTDLCPSSLAARCPPTSVGPDSPDPRLHPTLPPPSGDAPGMLATVDLPVLPDLAYPWVGTRPQRARRNPAQTTCDHADFAAAGARPRSRTFLVPQAKLPARFGLSETYGTFPSRSAANRFFDRIRTRMATCEKKEPGTRLTGHRSHRTPGHAGRPSGDEYALWHVHTQVSRHRKVSYLMGMVRAGRRVAQVTFAPTAHAKMSEAGFADVLVRARERLRELPSTEDR